MVQPAAATASGGESEDVVGRSANGIFAKLQFVFPSFPSPKRAQTLPSLSPQQLKQKSKFIKVRIMTWNMHDSLPTGNLNDLLGSVPPFVERNIENDDERLHLPDLTLDDGHPYHIVIIGGQECPTLSGIPMGLAANFKHKDSNNHHYDNDKTKNKRRASELPRNEHRQAVHHADGAVMPQITSGWTAVLEDWFSNGVGSLNDVKPVVTTDPVEGLASSTSISPDIYTVDHEPNLINVNWEATDRREVKGRTNKLPLNAFPSKGPYQLLVKDRLMGIYTAVFVHRDIYPLIKGVSTVPAGLIGGRLGNKGGVGVSINLNGTRLLFINAHLAAHDGNVALRVANMSKIKAELTVDPFLPPDDVRLLKEDLSERFDYTWIFGDLNFRLDITRLHADWLIARKEFSKAFAFDELHELVKGRNPVFEGFKEGRIDFPPTFKYNVPHKRHKFHRRKAPGVEAVKEDSEFPFNVTGSMSSVSSGVSFLDIRKRPANRPIHTLLSRIASTSGRIWKRIKSKNKKPCRKDISNGITSAISKWPAETKSHAKMQHDVQKQATKFLGGENLNSTAGKSNGYDSSSKQRVPSWCDRILWKTTVKPEEFRLLDHVNVRNLKYGKIRKPSRIHTADSYALGRHIQATAPRPSLTNIVLSSESRAAFFGWRRRSSNEGNTSDPRSTTSAAGRRSVSVGEEYHEESNQRPVTRFSSISSRSKARGIPSAELASSGISPRRWLPQFLTNEPRDSSQTSRSSSLKLNRDGTLLRRGELVCLSYHTLDDEQMNKLEGWSDHRPVIGSYAIHL